MIETGLKHSSELTVTENVTAMVIGSGDMPVLATPMYQGDGEFDTFLIQVLPVYPTRHDMIDASKTSSIRLKQHSLHTICMEAV